MTRWSSSHIPLSSFPQESSRHECLITRIAVLLEQNRQPPGSIWLLCFKDSSCMSYSAVSVIVVLLSRAPPEI